MFSLRMSHKMVVILAFELERKRRRRRRRRMWWWWWWWKGITLTEPVSFFYVIISSVFVCASGVPGNRSGPCIVDQGGRTHHNTVIGGWDWTLIHSPILPSQLPSPYSPITVSTFTCISPRQAIRKIFKTILTVSQAGHKNGKWILTLRNVKYYT